MELLQKGPFFVTEDEALESESTRSRRVELRHDTERCEGIAQLERTLEHHAYCVPASLDRAHKHLTLDVLIPRKACKFSANGWAVEYLL